MNGLALSGFVDGQRAAMRDRLALAQERRIAAQHPLDIQALQQQNYQRGLVNQQTEAMNPLTVTQQKQGNYARDLSNQQTEAMNPLTVTQQRQGNYARDLSNQQTEAMNPLQLNQQQLANTGNQQLNTKRGLELQSAQQLQPTENALALQNATQALAKTGINQGIQAYRTTGNIEHLKQAINGAHGGNVKIQPLPDGSVQVQDTDGAQRFGSMDEFLQVVGQTAADQKSIQQEWVSAGDGYAMNRATGEAKQLYEKAQKPEALPVDALALNAMTAGYLKDKGVDLSENDMVRVNADMQTRASALMRSGADPSAAVQQAYQSIEPAISEADRNMFQPFKPANQYDSSKLALSGSGAAVPAAPVAAPVAAAATAPASAVNYLKQNNTPEVRAIFQQKYGYLP